MFGLVFDVLKKKMYQSNVLEERRGVWAKTILKSKIFKKEVANLSQAINGEGI